MLLLDSFLDIGSLGYCGQGWFGVDEVLNCRGLLRLRDSTDLKVEISCTVTMNVFA
jgi:hypothetical protein